MWFSLPVPNNLNGAKMGCRGTNLYRSDNAGCLHVVKMHYKMPIDYNTFGMWEK